MQITTLQQGTSEWKEHRRKFRNASDTPAMLGISPYKTRDQFIREMKTGVEEEVSAFQQRRFDKGHRFEALARGLAEQIIGEELFPVVGTIGVFSASFDGLTMDESTGFEHKSLNADLRVAIRQQGGSANEFLAEHYRAQMEHQCTVSGAERVLFMASQWSDDGDLVEERHCWYVPDLELRKKIVLGWEQFDKDLQDYEVAAAAAPKPVGNAPELLPALRIEVVGNVTATNLPDFKRVALARIRGINRELTEDQHFADAEQTVKWLADVESRLEGAKRHALSQTASIDELFRTIDDITAESKKARLELDKLVKAKKEQIRDSIINEAMVRLKGFMNQVNAEFPKTPICRVMPDFAGAIKGKRSIDSMRAAVHQVETDEKLATNDQASKVRANLQTLVVAGYAELFPDLHSLVMKSAEDLQATITARIAQAKEAEEKKRLADEAAKAAEQKVDPAPAVAAPVSAQSAPAYAPSAPRPVPSTDATISLGWIKERLAPVAISADGLASLGIQSCGKDRAAILYLSSQFPLICAKIIEHITKAVATSDQPF